MQSNNIVNQKEYEVTQENITSMAREAGYTPINDYYTNGTVLSFSDDQIKRFAALVAAAEREACAKVADIGNDPRPASNPERYLPGVNTASKLVAQDIAYKIRARSMK